jgi:2-keto-myo-inositol isomerase
MSRSSRRQFFQTSALGAAALAGAAAHAAPQPDSRGFRYCLNTATLQGYKLGIVELVDIAGKAGYQAIEPWLAQITAYTEGGGSLSDLRKRIVDRGLTVEGAIAFAQWLVDDPEKRGAGVEQARREMDAVAQIGGKRIAAPPAGANSGAEIALPRVAERYRVLLEAGDRMGVVPELEFWGHSVNLRRLADAAFVVIQVDHPKACLLADVFHMYKGGSGFGGLRLLSSQAIQVIHMNDYPATPARESITDRDRVFPGDGVAPLKQVLTDLQRVNPAAVLSLEVFNPAYWKGDPLETARTGLAKMKTAVEKAAAG